MAVFTKMCKLICICSIPITLKSQHRRNCFSIRLILVRTAHKKNDSTINKQPDSANPERCFNSFNSFPKFSTPHSRIQIATIPKSEVLNPNFPS